MYKIYASDNYIIVTKIQNNETFYGHKKNVFIDKSNVNKPVYSIFNVKDLKDDTIVAIGEIQKQDGSLYTEAEFDTFYRTNTGNFNGGGTAPTGIESLTGDSVDNTDPLNPIINAIPLTGTTVGNPVTGDIEFQSAISRKITSLTGGYIEFVDDGTMNINKDGGSNVNITGIDIAGFTNLDFGIRGFQDFTPNITDLDYPQKIYVDTHTQRTTATTGTVNIDSGKRDLVLIHEAGATTTLNLNLPTSPKNNDKVTIMSVGGIVGLTLATAVGTIIGAVTTLAALGTTKLIWNSSQSKWY
jgi:hypothetical protein